MEKQCSFCGNKHFHTEKIQYMYKHDGQFMMVNNVPCEVCDFCGEQYFEGNVLKYIEQQFRNVYGTGQPFRQEIRIPIQEYKVSQTTMNTLQQFKQIGRFLAARKLWWLSPIIIVLLLLGVLLIFSETSALAPFIYTLF